MELKANTGLLRSSAKRVRHKKRCEFNSHFLRFVGYSIHLSAKQLSQNKYRG